MTSFAVEFCDDQATETADRMHALIAAKYPECCTTRIRGDASGAMLHMQLLHDHLVEHEGATCDGPDGMAPRRGIRA